MLWFKQKAEAGYWNSDKEWYQYPITQSEEWYYGKTTQCEYFDKITLYEYLYYDLSTQFKDWYLNKITQC